MRRWFLGLSSIALASACGQVQRDAPTSLPTSAGGDGGTSVRAGDAGDAKSAVSEGGSGDGTEIAITGQVIDSWRRPVSGCLVALGNATAVTGGQGEFRFEHVTPPYDVAFAIPAVPDATTGPAVWLYTGLTRADPTLQFDRVLVNQLTLLSVERTNIPILAPDSEAAAKVRLGVSFAAPGLELGAPDLTPVDEYGRYFLSAQWSGGSSLSGTVHSLASLSPSGDPGGLDLQFLSYQERAFTLSDDPSLGPLARLTLDFSPSTVPSETYPVTIEGAPDSEVTLGSAVVFDSNAAIWLAARQNPEALSNVPMPVLPGGHAVFSASRSASPSGFGLVHRRADSSSSVTALSIPTPRTLTAPDDEASDVTASTRFEWSDGASVSVLRIHCWQSSLDVNVVTAKNSATFPVLPALSSAFPNKSTFGWGVEVDGAFGSVDEAAGPTGFLAACGSVSNCVRGPRLDDGSLTQSSWRTFSSAP